MGAERQRRSTQVAPTFTVLLPPCPSPGRTQPRGPLLLLWPAPITNSSIPCTRQASQTPTWRSVNGLCTRSGTATEGDAGAEMRQLMTWGKWFFLPQEEPVHPEEAARRPARPRGCMGDSQAGAEWGPEAVPGQTEADAAPGRRFGGAAWSPVLRHQLGTRRHRP